MILVPKWLSNSLKFHDYEKLFIMQNFYRNCLNYYLNTCVCMKQVPWSYLVIIAVFQIKIFLCLFFKNSKKLFQCLVISLSDFYYPFFRPTVASLNFSAIHSDHGPWWVYGESFFNPKARILRYFDGTPVGSKRERSNKQWGATGSLCFSRKFYPFSSFFTDHYPSLLSYFPTN